MFVQIRKWTVTEGNAEKIIDKADYQNCTARAEGLNFVIVGGKVAAENSVYNGVRNGIVYFK